MKIKKTTKRVWMIGFAIILIAVLISLLMLQFDFVQENPLWNSESNKLLKYITGEYQKIIYFGITGEHTTYLLFTMPLLLLSFLYILYSIPQNFLIRLLTSIFVVWFVIPVISLISIVFTIYAIWAFMVVVFPLLLLIKIALIIKNRDRGK